MDEDEDLDTHICLACQIPILGLDNYIYHKKVTCPAKKTHDVPKVPSMVVGNAMPPQQMPSMSATKCETTTGATEGVTFCRSLVPNNIPYTSHADTVPLQDRVLPPTTTVHVPVPLSENLGLLVAQQQQQQQQHEATTSSISVDTSTAYISTPTRFSIVDPNMVLCSMTSSGSGLLPQQQRPLASLAGTDSSTSLQDNAPSIMDFLSSLELQCRSTPPQGKAMPSGDRVEGLGTMDDRVALENRESDGLKLVSLLNDLNFDSDSEGFDMPSDTEDLLNFDEDVYPELNSSYASISLKGKEVGYGKGKGKTAVKTDAIQYAWRGGKKGKSQSYPGKWRPGERQHSGGKSVSMRQVSIGKRHYEELSSDEEEQASLATNQVAKEDNGGGTRRSIKDHVTSVADDSEEVLESQDPETVVAAKKMNLSKKLINQMREVCDLSLNTTQTEISPTDLTISKPANVPTVPVPEFATDHDYIISNEVEEHGAGGSFQCEPCSKPFKNRKALHTHIRSEQHEQLVSLAEDQRKVLKIKNKDVVGTRKRTKSAYQSECPSCQKSFNNKYNFVRHLLTSIHQRRSHSVSFQLDPGFQRLMLRLKPFQCRICDFFCNTHEDLVLHFGMEQHLEQVKELLGPMCCVRCLYISRSHADVMAHFHADVHRDKIASSNRPCTLREVRKDLDCLLCKKKFHSATSLKKHLSSKHPKRPLHGNKRGRKDYVCLECDKSCKTKYNMVIHMRRKHTHEKPYSCDACNKKFIDQSTLKVHFRSQKHLHNVLKCSVTQSPIKPSRKTVRDRAKIYKCKECDFSSTVYSELRPHYVTSHRTNMFLCEVCGIKFVNQNMLEKHRETNKHKKNEQDAEALGHSSYVCTQCGHKFYSKEKLSLHVLSHFPASAEKSKDPKQLLLAGVPKAFHSFVSLLPKNCPGTDVECPVCNKVFKHSNIVVHLRSHGDPNKQPYKCNFCAKTFTSNSTLYRHHKSHLGIRPFECNFCSKTFKCASQLSSHQLKAHPKQTDVKPKFHCSTCGQVFVEASRYKLHIKYHDKSQKQFKCLFKGCNKSFVLLGTLKDHERVHTGEKPYLCDLCGFATKTSTHMTRHRRVHTGECNYQCEYCTFKASHSWGLRRHMRIHIGCKPYKCPYCDYRCNCHTNLRHHVLSSKLHAGMHIYRCKFCEMGTNHAKDYQKHMIDIHQVPEEDIENIGVYAGIYIKENDTRAVEEGSQVLPVRERRARLPKVANKGTSPYNDAHQELYPIEHTVMYQEGGQINSTATNRGTPHKQLPTSEESKNDTFQVEHTIMFQDGRQLESATTPKIEMPATEVYTYHTLQANIMGASVIHQANPHGYITSYQTQEHGENIPIVHTTHANTLIWPEQHNVQ